MSIENTKLLTENLKKTMEGYEKDLEDITNSSLSRLNGIYQDLFGKFSKLENFTEIASGFKSYGIIHSSMQLYSQFVTIKKLDLGEEPQTTIHKLVKYYNEEIKVDFS